MSTRKEILEDMVENSLLTLTYYETFRDPKKAAELNDMLVEALSAIKISKGSFSLLHMLVEQYSLDTGKTADETIQMLRGKLLGML